MKIIPSMKNFEMVKRFMVLGVAFFFCAQFLVFAQEEVQSSLDDAEIVESGIDMEDVQRESDEATEASEPLVSVEPTMPVAAVALRGIQIIELNQTLKNIIEQNSVLRKEKDELDGEVKYLRGQRKIEGNRFDAMRDEMRRIQQQADEIVNVNQRYSRQVVDLQTAIKTKESEYQLKIKELQEKVPEGAEGQQLASSAGASGNVSSSARKRSVEVDVVSMMEQFSLESENLKRDTAKVHYNMGNIFFRKGEYKKAVLQYRKVLELMPTDPAAHFNLAFVSGEYLSDPVTALKHYREYIFLNPDAPDAGTVQEKILEANLAVRMLIDSPLDRIPKVK